MPVCTTIYAPNHMTLGDLLLRICEVCCAGKNICGWKTCTRSYENFNWFCH